MMHRRFSSLVLGLLLGSLSLAAPRPAAAAAATVTFDTVDTVELNNGDLTNSVFIVVTGILAGESTPTTMSFQFGTATVVGLHCERLAMIAMAKPGKYQLAIGATFSSATCRLIVRTP